MVAKRTTWGLEEEELYQLRRQALLDILSTIKKKIIKPLPGNGYLYFLPGEYYH